MFHPPVGQGSCRACCASKPRLRRSPESFRVWLCPTRSLSHLWDGRSRRRESALTLPRPAITAGTPAFRCPPMSGARS